MSRKPGAPPAATPDPDLLLFAEAVADARPIEPSHRAPEGAAPEPMPLSQRDEEVIRELDALVSGEAPFELQHSDAFMEGGVPGLDPRVLRRLRAGEFTPQAHLDLHGTAAETARARVERFIVHSHALGLRCLRIVHGKGRNSPGGIGVLKESLPRWLARGPARHLVIAYSSARPADGGTGASYVLLRRNRRGQGR